ncbi:hypothetical protein JCM3770_003119 [Rhodotorula araucariae]
MALSAKAEIRQQLNLKNLQRHDPLIDRIVTSTSHASLYDNKGDGWVKTGVEGPMFLFARSQSPHYGFFVLNRNGLEYVQEFLTPECEVEAGGEFILFEGGADADRATGIWVSEEKERAELSKHMRMLRSKAAAAASASAYTPSPVAPSPSHASRTAPAPALPVGQSISLDMLFSAASPTRLPAAAPRSAAPPPNPLDALFARATLSPSPAPASLPSAAATTAGRLPVQLEQLFAAASPTPASATLPPQQQQQQQPTGMALLDSIFASAKSAPSPQLAPAQPPAAAPPRPNDARALLAMLGHPLAPPAPAPAPAPVTARASDTAPAPARENDATPAPALAPVHTTTHPAPFALEVAPAVAAPERKDLMDKDEGPAAAAAAAASRSGSGSGSASGPRAAVFARPVLSHDVFDALPLPLAAAKRAPVVPAPAAVTTTTVEEVKAVHAQEKAEPVVPPVTQLPVPTAPSPPAPAAPASAAAASVPATAPMSRASSSPAQPLLLSKPDVVAFADTAAAAAAVGIETGREAPMDKDEFVRRVVELLQVRLAPRSLLPALCPCKPSLSTQLYGRYLERFEEGHE